MRTWLAGDGAVRWRKQVNEFRVGSTRSKSTGDFYVKKLSTEEKRWPILTYTIKCNHRGMLYDVSGRIQACRRNSFSTAARYQIHHDASPRTDPCLLDCMDLMKATAEGRCSGSWAANPVAHMHAADSTEAGKQAQKRPCAPHTEVASRRGQEGPMAGTWTSRRDHEEEEDLKQSPGVTCLVETKVQLSAY